MHTRGCFLAGTGTFGPNTLAVVKRIQAQKDAIGEARGNFRYRSSHEQDASALVRAARLALGMDRDEFAERLDAELGWAVDADTIARWERASTPPGGVVALCATLADWPNH